MKKERSRNATLSVKVIVVSLLAIVTAFLATANVNVNPSITWVQGDDYSQAQGSGFAGSFSTSNKAAFFTLTISGLSGGTVTIDKLLNITAA